MIFTGINITYYLLGRRWWLCQWKSSLTTPASSILRTRFPRFGFWWFAFVLVHVADVRGAFGSVCQSGCFINFHTQEFTFPSLQWRVSIQSHYLDVFSACGRTCFFDKSEARARHGRRPSRGTFLKQEVIGKLCPLHRDQSRGGICHSRHSRRECKIFASGVNFSRNNAVCYINESKKLHFILISSLKLLTYY